MLDYERLMRERGHGIWIPLLRAFTIKDMDHDIAQVNYLTREISINHSILPTEGMIEFLLRHELGHILHSHAKRGRDKQHGRWNIAADIELSNHYTDNDVRYLKRKPLGGNPNIHTSHPQYAGWTAEDIYEDLPCDDSCKGDSNSGEPDDELTAIALEVLTQLEAIEGFKEQECTYEHVPQDKLKYSLRRYFREALRVEKHRSYRRPNKKYTNIIMKGVTTRHKPAATIAIYCDCSGSMDGDKVQRAATLASDCGNIRGVTPLVYYFNTEVYPNPQVAGGGTDYAAVFDHARKHKYTCIVLITDDDMPVGWWEGEAAWVVAVGAAKTNIVSNIHATFQEEVAI